MLIPALIEGIMALAAGSVAGVAKAIEIGLARLIPLVIGLLASLIGLGGLSKKVMKIFKKIRKRIDKAVNKLLMKAKKAGRKLMRKLGIGKKKKKKKGDKDDRTPQEMQADLKKGIQEATTFVKAGGKDQKQIKKQLDKIENKYDLVELKLVVDKQNPEGKDKMHIEGEVNPKGKGPGFEEELDGQDTSNITVGKEISAKYGERNYRAIVKKVDEQGDQITYEFKYENLTDRLETLSFDAFDKKVKNGEINLSPGKGGEEHTQYKPDPDSIKTEIKDGKFTLSYKYLPLEDGEIPPSFKATVSISEGELFTHSVNGSGLAVKVSGTRGVNTAESSNKAGTHRAHLIADWYRGSGYKNALNIINTSSEYNTGPMYDAEGKIVNGAKDVEKQHSGKQVTFDMEVIAEYIILTDQTTLDSFKSNMEKGETDELYKILKNNKDPRQTQKVNYEASNFKADGESVTGSVKAKAGKDKWV